MPGKVSRGAAQLILAGLLVVGFGPARAASSVDEICEFAFPTAYCRTGEADAPWRSACEAEAAGDRERALALVLESGTTQIAVDFALPEICERARNGERKGAIELARSAAGRQRTDRVHTTIDGTLGLKLAAVALLQQALGAREDAGRTIDLIAEIARGQILGRGDWMTSLSSATLFAKADDRAAFERAMTASIDGLMESYRLHGPVTVQSDLIDGYLYQRFQVLGLPESQLSQEAMRYQFEATLTELVRLGELALNDKDRAKLDGARAQVAQALRMPSPEAAGGGDGRPVDLRASAVGDAALQSVDLFDAELSVPVPRWAAMPATGDPERYSEEAAPASIIIRQVPEGETLVNWRRQIGIAAFHNDDYSIAGLPTLQLHEMRSLRTRMHGICGADRVELKVLASENDFLVHRLVCEDSGSGPAAEGYGAGIGQLSLTLVELVKDTFVAVRFSWRGEGMALDDPATWPISGADYHRALASMLAIRMTPSDQSTSKPQ